jgi:hypothetical protein
MKHSYICENKEAGFIALVTVLVMTGVLAGLAFTLSVTGYFSRFNILQSIFKEESSALAEACAEFAILHFAENDEYAGGENVNLGDQSCYINSVVSGNGSTSIMVSADVEAFITNLVINIDSDTLAVNSWREIVGF